MTPEAVALTVSSTPEDVRCVWVRIIPMVGLPCGSIVANSNSRLGFPHQPFPDRGHSGKIGVLCLIIAIEHINLALDLAVGDILVWCVEDDVNHDLELGRAAGNPAGAAEEPHARGEELQVHLIL